MNNGTTTREIESYLADLFQNRRPWTSQTDRAGDFHIVLRMFMPEHKLYRSDINLNKLYGGVLTNAILMAIMPYYMKVKMLRYNISVYTSNSLECATIVINMCSNNPQVTLASEEILAKLGRKYAKNKYRFIVIPVLVSYDKWLHQNLLIYDAQTETMEHFDPHGGGGCGNVTNHATAQLRDIFASVMPIRNMDMSGFKCPGIQVAQEGERLTTDMDVRGYCLYWSWLYLETRLLNPDKTASFVHERLQQTIEKLGMSLTEYIREYFLYLCNLYYKILHIAVSVPYYQSKSPSVVLFDTTLTKCAIDKMCCSGPHDRWSQKLRLNRLNNIVGTLELLQQQCYLRQTRLVASKVVIENVQPTQAIVVSMSYEFINQPGKATVKKYMYPVYNVSFDSLPPKAYEQMKQFFLWLTCVRILDKLT